MRFFKQFFVDSDGMASSKRLMTFGAFLLFVQTVEMNLLGGTELNSTMLTFLLTLIGGGMGLTTIENISTKPSVPIK